MPDLYDFVEGSPITKITKQVDELQEHIEIQDTEKVPPAPNQVTLFNKDNQFETILYEGVSGSTLTNVTRGFEGTAQSWDPGTTVSRLITSHDLNTLNSGVLDLVDAVFTDGIGSSSRVAELESSNSDKVDQIDFDNLDNQVSSNTNTLNDKADQTSLNSLSSEVDGKVSKSGDTMSGNLKVNGSGYTQLVARNIYISSGSPSSSVGDNGDIWLQYE